MAIASMIVKARSKAENNTWSYSDTFIGGAGAGVRVYGSAPSSSACTTISRFRASMPSISCSFVSGVPVVGVLVGSREVPEVEEVESHAT